MTTTTYQHLITDDVDDALSDAIYKNSKLDYLFSLNDEVEESSLIATNTSQDQEIEKSTYQPQWKLLRTLAGAHQGWVRAIALDEVTNKWFATGSADSTIKIWDLASSNLKTTLTGHIMGVRSLVMSKKFPYLFSGAEDKTLRCWDLERSNQIEGCQIKNFYGHVGGIYALALHEDLDILLSGGRDAVVRIWDINTSTEIAQLSGHTDDITSIHTNSYDPQVFTSSMDGTIRLWDLRNQKTEVCITQHSKSIRSMAKNPKEATFISGDSNGNIKQWLLPNGELINNFERNRDQKSENKIINSLCINPITNTLFTGYDNGRIEFHDYISGQLVQQGATPSLPGSEGSAIYASTFDMSGLRLITGEGDKSIKIWGEAN
ncbi:PRP46 [Candida pseudojiufengensis]|uniref:PRP46 n=1 Tax=Candida pseudojiufengensis TaxID=497109 RepID=UPI0022258426|nr:PRP46 [Candida pseudojiufengensis]KAI5959512.1 PRP46 [Candida pseudojiufengensis]